MRDRAHDYTHFVGKREAKNAAIWADFIWIPITYNKSLTSVSILRRIAEIWTIFLSFVISLGKHIFLIAIELE